MGRSPASGSPRSSPWRRPAPRSSWVSPPPCRPRVYPAGSTHPGTPRCWLIEPDLVSQSQTHVSLLAALVFGAFTLVCLTRRTPSAVLSTAATIICFVLSSSLLQPQTILLVLLLVPLFSPVSYTHLRAHETRHDLVCRLLLE